MLFSNAMRTVIDTIAVYITYRFILSFLGFYFVQLEVLPIVDI